MKIHMPQLAEAREWLLSREWRFNSVGKVGLSCALAFLGGTSCSSMSTATQGANVNEPPRASTSVPITQSTSNSSLEAQPFDRAEAAVLGNGTLSRGDLAGLSASELSRLRNTVHARHGRSFQSADLKQHFTSRAWYRPDASYSDSKLTAEDRANVNLITQMESTATSQQADASTPSQDVEAAMRKFIAAVRGKDTKTFLSLLPRNEPWRLTTTITVPPTAETFTYEQTRQELDAQDGLFMRLFGNEYTDSFADSWLSSARMWKQAGANSFTPPNTSAGSNKVTVKWRKEGDRWVLDEIAYPSS